MPHGAARPPDDRPQRGAGEEQQPADCEQDAERRCAGGADTRRDTSLELLPDHAAVAATEGEHQAEQRRGEAQPERPHLDERAPRHDQRSERDQHDRRDVGRPADRHGGVPDRAAAQAEPQHAGEEDPEGGETRARSARDDGGFRTARRLRPS